MNIWLTALLLAAQSEPEIVLVGDDALGRAVAERLKGLARVRSLARGQAPTEKPDILHVSAAIDDLGPYKIDADRVWAAEAPKDVEIRRALELGFIVQDLAATPDRVESVVDCLRRRLKVVVRKPRTSTPPESAEAYRKREAERDALVPERYKALPFGEFKVPESAEEWTSRRPATLKAVVDSLGDLPRRPSPLSARLVCRELHPGFSLEKIAIDNGVDNTIPALLLLPSEPRGPVPAVMWLHSTSPDSNQILTPGTYGGERPLGEELIRAGFAVFAPDAYWHGDRAGTGPSGAGDAFREEHVSLHKLNLWMGRTLWGMFVRDDQIALDYLCARPEIDRARIGATGMSMGSTRSWWLAAVDERIACAVGTACLTRYQNLIAHGQLQQHGLYYFSFGLLKHFDTEGVVALIAPRPFLALTGALDAGSPADGVRAIEERAGKVYERLGARERFRSVLYEDVGHTVTPTMRAETLAWFQRWLRPESR
jgi:dienelactone hydrolase